MDRRHGTERALAELLDRLAYKYGCEIHLYAQRVEDLHLGSVEKLASPPSGVIVWHRVPSIPGPHLLQFLFWICLSEIFIWADAVLRKRSFDHVLSPGINGFSADVVIVHALFHRLRELSVQAKSETASASAGFLRGAHRRLYYAILSGLERRIYSNRNVALVSVSRRIAVLLEKYFNRRDVTVIPNGVDTSYFSRTARLALRAEGRKRRGLRDDEIVLLLLGNDWGTKGLPAVLEAMSSLKHLPLRLIVVGNDDPRPFRAKAEQLGVQQLCLWETPGPNVLDFYAAADLYVSPSREDSFGLPVLEAMACGLPIITSAFAGVSDLLHDGVNSFILNDPCEAASLAQSINLLCEQPELRDRIGQAAEKTAATFSWDRNAEDIWALLKTTSKLGMSKE